MDGDSTVLEVYTCSDRMDQLKELEESTECAFCLTTFDVMPTTTKKDNKETMHHRLPIQGSCHHKICQQCWYYLQVMESDHASRTHAPLGATIMSSRRNRRHLSCPSCSAHNSVGGWSARDPEIDKSLCTELHATRNGMRRGLMKLIAKNPDTAELGLLPHALESVNRRFSSASTAHQHHCQSNQRGLLLHLSIVHEMVKKLSQNDEFYGG